MAKPGSYGRHEVRPPPDFSPPQLAPLTGRENPLLGLYILGYDTLAIGAYVVSLPILAVTSVIYNIDKALHPEDFIVGDYISVTQQPSGIVFSAKSTPSRRGTITAPRRPRTFDYAVDFNFLNLFSKNCTGTFPFTPASCNAAVASESSYYVNYTGWDVSIDVILERNFPCVSICGHFRTNVLTAWIEFDCHFVPSTIADSTSAPSIHVEMTGRRGSHDTFAATADLTADIRDGQTYHVIGPVAYPLIGDVTTDNGIDVEVHLHMEGGHAVAGTGPFLYIENLHLRGTAYGYSVPNI